MIGRMCAYAKDEEVANKLRDKIQSFPNHNMEELILKHGGYKFEFSGTMMDCVELMGLGASSASKL